MENTQSDLVKNYLKTHRNEWLQNPHVKYVFTSIMKDNQTREEMREYLKKLENDSSLKDQPLPKFFDKDGLRAITLAVDNLEDESILEIKKKIEDDKIPVELVFQKEPLKH